LYRYIAVCARGTAVARYFERDEPVYDDRQVGEDEDGNPVMERQQVGTRAVVDKDVDEFVDVVQFAVLNAADNTPVGRYRLKSVDPTKLTNVNSTISTACV
jgi:hypothetical protein